MLCLRSNRWKLESLDFSRSRVSVYILVPTSASVWYRLTVDMILGDGIGVEVKSTARCQRDNHARPSTSRAKQATKYNQPCSASHLSPSRNNAASKQRTTDSSTISSGDRKQSTQCRTSLQPSPRRPRPPSEQAALVRPDPQWLDRRPHEPFNTVLRDVLHRQPMPLTAPRLRRLAKSLYLSWHSQLDSRASPPLR